MYVGPWQELVLAKRLYAKSKREVVVDQNAEPNNELTALQQGPPGDFLPRHQHFMSKNEKNVRIHSSTITSRKNVRQRPISVAPEENIGDDGFNSYCSDNRVQTIGALSGGQRETVLSGDSRYAFIHLFIYVHLKTTCSI